MLTRIMLTVGAFVSFLALAWSTSGLNAQALTAAQTSPRRRAAGAPLVAEWRLGAAIKFGNLTIFPVTASRWPEQDQFITLDAGLKSGQVKITELGAEARQDQGTARQAQSNAEVNRLSLGNRSGKPLLLVAGEMLLGGQQDRIDASDRIVSPSDEPTQLAVFCVEPGRWNGAEQFGLAARADRLGAGAAAGVGSGTGGGVGPGVGYGNAGGHAAGPGSGPGSAGSLPSMAETVITASPSDGAVGGIANSKVREKAEVSRDQAQVWSSVEVTAKDNMVVTKSGSLQHVYDDKKVSDRLSQYDRAFRSKLGAKNVVGVVVAINGKVQLADIFASPSLFQAYWPKLLKSYALEALSSGRRYTSEARIANARSFLSPVRGDESSEGEEGVYRLTRRSAQGGTSFELEYTAGVAPVLVHFNRISNK